MNARLFFHGPLPHSKLLAAGSFSINAQSIRPLFHRLATGFLLVLLLSSLCFVENARAEQTVFPQMVRLHVLANSDSAEDQRVKLCVRDAIRGQAAALCAGAANADEAYERLQSAVDALTRAANEELVRQRSQDSATVELGVFDFPDKTYAGQLVPAGTYRAVRVRIGEAAGQNWWCVLYPDLCCVDEACAQAAAEYDITFYSSIARFFARWFNREVLS